MELSNLLQQLKPIARENQAKHVIPDSIRHARSIAWATSMLSKTEWRSAKQLAEAHNTLPTTVKHLMKRMRVLSVVEQRWVRVRGRTARLEWRLK